MNKSHFPGSLVMILTLTLACSSYTIKEQQKDTDRIAKYRATCTEGLDRLKQAKRQNDSRKLQLSGEIIALCSRSPELIRARTPEVIALQKFFSPPAGTVQWSDPASVAAYFVPRRAEMQKRFDAAAVSVKNLRFQDGKAVFDNAES